jgi:four helix bundle protein
MRIERFEDIEAWQLARDLARRIYRVTAVGDFCRDPGLKSQIRNAAGSIMHNIAEGFDSATNREFVRFLVYARRSCTEVQSQLYLASDAGYLDEGQLRDFHTRAGRARATIKGFIRYLEGCRGDEEKTRRDMCPPTRNPEPGTRNLRRGRDDD